MVSLMVRLGSNLLMSSSSSATYMNILCQCDISLTCPITNVSYTCLAACPYFCGSCITRSAPLPQSSTIVHVCTVHNYFRFYSIPFHSWAFQLASIMACLVSSMFLYWLHLFLYTYLHLFLTEGTFRDSGKTTWYIYGWQRTRSVPLMNQVDTEADRLSFINWEGESVTGVSWHCQSTPMIHEQSMNHVSIKIRPIGVLQSHHPWQLLKTYSYTELWCNIICSSCSQKQRSNSIPPLLF